MTPPAVRMGCSVQDFIINSSLIGHAEDHPIVFVWSANAPEQIGQFIREHIDSWREQIRSDDERG